MKLILTCDGSRDSIVRCCQGAAIVVCSKADMEKFENAEEILGAFKDNKLTDHMTVLGILISIRQINPNFPVLDVIDFFAFHRHHQVYLEISE